MARVEFDLDDLTNAALKRLVKQLLVAGDGQEQRILAQLSKTQKAEKETKKTKVEKNELADLDEEMHGKPKTPTVEKDDLPEEDDE